MEQRRNDPCRCGSGLKYKKCCAETAAGAGRDKLTEAAALVRLGDFPAAAEHFAGVESVADDGAAPLYRLGVALNERGLAAEAADCYRQALARRPDYVEALSNLGVILQERKEFTEAAALLRKARQLRPDVAMGHYNLGVVLVELNRIAEARACFARTLELQPDYVEALYNLGLLAREKGDWTTAAASFRRAVELRPDYPRTQTELAILAWMRGDFAVCSSCLEQAAASRRSLSPKEQKFVGPYGNFLRKLLEYRRVHADLYQGDQDLPLLYAVGDSHCLAPAHLPVLMRAGAYLVAARIVVGAKAWHLGRQQTNRYQQALEEIVAAIPAGAPALVAFGEIDCRLDEGIILHHRKTGSDLGRTIPQLVADYLACLDRLFAAGSTRLLVANVPAPIIKSPLIQDEERHLQALVVREFNRALAAGCGERNFRLLDLYAPTAGPDGLAHGQGHLDTVHLEPALYKRLLEEL
jgi:Tfp pilus assembly protein PilF